VKADLAWLGAAALLLGACALGPDYRRPALDVPKDYQWQLPQDAAAEFGDRDWWALYRDPMLQRALDIALERNLDVRIAATRIEQARAMLGATRLQYWPQLSLGAQAERSKTSSYTQLLPEQPRLGTIYDASIDASYELDIWGRLRRLNEAARADMLASVYAQRSVVVGLIADVATAYFTLISLDEQLAVTRSTVATRRKFVELTRAKHDRGVVSGLDVSTAEAELATAQANIPDLERQIGQTEDQLSVLLGHNPGPIRRAHHFGDSPPLPPAPPAGLPSSLLERRPDILRAEQQLRAANARVGAAKAALFPTLSLTGSYGGQSLELSKLFSGPANTWLAGAGVTLPLLDAGNSLYQLDLADATKREALLSYEQSVLNALKEVSDALIARQKYVEFQQAQAAKVDALRRANAIALARYQVGYASYFDVINSDRDLFNAQLDLAAAYLNSQLANVRLYQALGGGWRIQEGGRAPGS